MVLLVLFLTASAVVGFEPQSYTTFEGAGSVMVCVTIEEPGFPTPVFNLLLTTQDGSAS